MELQDYNYVNHISDPKAINKNLSNTQKASEDVKRNDSKKEEKIIFHQKYYWQPLLIANENMKKT